MTRYVSFTLFVDNGSDLLFRPDDFMGRVKEYCVTGLADKLWKLKNSIARVLSTNLSPQTSDG